MGIRQLNCEYRSQEDRLVFRISTEQGDEFSLLLTRRVALFILKSSEQLIQKQLERQHAATVAKSIVEFEVEAAREVAQFEHKYSGGTHHPLGQFPVLVHEVSCQSVVHEGVAKIALEFLLENQKTIKLQLWGNILHNTRLLLERMVNQASWIVIPQEPETNDDRVSKETSSLPLH